MNKNSFLLQNSWSLALSNLVLKLYACTYNKNQRCPFDNNLK